MRRWFFLSISFVLLACHPPSSGSKARQRTLSPANDDDGNNYVRSGDLSDSEVNENAPRDLKSIDGHPEVVYLLRRTKSPLPNGGTRTEFGPCTGTFVQTEQNKSRRVILTAKHCLSDQNARYYAFSGEGTRINSDEFYDPRQVFEKGYGVALAAPLADGDTSNANLGPRGFQFSDVAIMVTDRDLDEGVEPATLSRQAPDKNSECEGTGYGDRNGSKGWKRPVTLNLDEVDAYNLSTRSTNEKDPASLPGSGDSGGPLFCKQNGQVNQVGVMSAGYDSTKEPAFYARADILYDTVDKVIAQVEKAGNNKPLDVPRQSVPSPSESASSSSR